MSTFSDCVGASTIRQRSVKRDQNQSSPFWPQVSILFVAIQNLRDNKRNSSHSFSCSWPSANWLLIEIRSKSFLARMPSPLSSGWLWPLSGGEYQNIKNYNLYLWQNKVYICGKTIYICEGKKNNLNLRQNKEVDEARTEVGRGKRASLSLSPSLTDFLTRYLIVKSESAFLR